MKRILQKAIVLFMMCVVIGVVFAFVFDHLQKDNLPNSKQNPAVNAQAVNQVVNKEDMGITGIVQQVRDAVVVVLKEQELSYYGKQITSGGSGVVYAEDKDNYYILTNNHVIDKGDALFVELRGEKRIQVKLVGSDADTDIAVLQLSKKDVDADTQIKVAEMGDTSSLEPGATVIAVGNSLGYGQSITKGIISAIDRDIHARSSFAYRLIQTDAAINPGNSGGALIDMQGKVIGINTLKIASQPSQGGSIPVEGVGFAIPVEASVHIGDTLRNKGFLPKTYIGISMKTPNPIEMESRGLPMGVLIVNVSPNSPAEKAGLQNYDIITRIDDKEIESGESFGYQIRSKSPGDTVQLTVFRDGETLKIPVKLEESKQ